MRLLNVRSCRDQLACLLDEAMLDEHLVLRRDDLADRSEVSCAAPGGGPELDLAPEKPEHRTQDRGRDQKAELILLAAAVARLEIDGWFYRPNTVRLIGRDDQGQARSRALRRPVPRRGLMPARVHRRARDCARAATGGTGLRAGTPVTRSA